MTTATSAYLCNKENTCQDPLDFITKLVSCSETKGKLHKALVATTLSHFLLLQLKVG